MRWLERYLLIRDYLLGSAYLDALKRGDAERCLELEREMVGWPFPRSR